MIIGLKECGIIVRNDNTKCFILEVNPTIKDLEYDCNVLGLVEQYLQDLLANPRKTLYFIVLAERSYDCKKSSATILYHQ